MDELFPLRPLPGGYPLDRLDGGVAPFGDRPDGAATVVREIDLRRYKGLPRGASPNALDYDPILSGRPQEWQKPPGVSRIIREGPIGWRSRSIA
jgi:hypothetical protein